MSSSEIRQKFLEFFQARGHAIVPSASLVPENDPTTLFTSSGMQPLIPYLLGQPHPLGKRVANSQKSFRAEDIDEVGDNRHTTFFEMLGNWSFGDPDAADRIGAGYWKREQLPWFFEFLTKEIGIPKERLWVTCFAGDKDLNLSPDNESAEIWKSLGIPEERIKFYDSKKNWWSRSGVPANMPAGEPGGPDSEVFYEFTQVEHDKKFGEHCHPNCDCGRFLEIGNSVFMEYKKSANGSFEKLAQRNVDFGGGLERITAAANNSPDIFKTDIFKKVINEITGMGKEFTTWGSLTPDENRATRIVADHIRASVFLAADGVFAGNKGREYVVRRLLRRSLVYLARLGYLRETISSRLVDAVILGYEGYYRELIDNISSIRLAIESEVVKFGKTLEKGQKELEKILTTGSLSGKEAFDLFQTYGYPRELTYELAEQRGIGVSREDFEAEFQKHQEKSRTASAGMFKGGLADHSEKTTRLHTAHHLLLKALQVVLGPQVKQRGSNITSERLRLDFLHGEKMTESQKKEVERIVNEKIAEDLPVIRSEMAREEAEKLGAEHEFGQKYPERASVYSIGPKDAAQENPKFDEAFSIEFCGGPHVARTGEIGKFQIVKEEAVAAGVRRIRGVIA